MKAIKVEGPSTCDIDSIVPGHGFQLSSGNCPPRPMVRLASSDLLTVPQRRYILVLDVNNNKITTIAGDVQCYPISFTIEVCQ